MSQLKLISDFNIQVLAGYLANTDELKNSKVDIAPFGQVYQNLLQITASEADTGTTILWTRPETILETYRKALYFQPVDHATVFAELDQYIDAIKRYAEQVKYIIHPSWILPFEHRGYGLLDYKHGLGLASLLSNLNLQLNEKLKDVPNFFMLDTENWIRQAGPRFCLPKMWYASKVPFNNKVFQAAARDIGSATQGLAGNSRKIIVVDLDNTLWGGVVGETGYAGIQLGGHDYVGEAFVEFQRLLKAYTNRGIQLAIVSKNDESVALEAIDKHPEMQLRRNDFAGWRINWADKAQNVIDLMQELNLGLESAVFIDDNPAERGRVKEALGGQVLVPDWPTDPTEYCTALSALNYFDSPSISDEDRERTKMYRSERVRRADRNNKNSLEEWLTTLEIRVTIEKLPVKSMSRVIQLLNKTNQMNMRTRRLSEDELQLWLQTDTRKMWVFRVADRYGDSGLTGIISTEIIDDTAYISDFLMSCRVMGRKIEEIMLHTVVNELQSQPGIKQLMAQFLPTERNKPCLAFWKDSGFTEHQESLFSWSLKNAYPKPAFILTEQVESI